MRVLVTGGGGFVGRAVVERLRARGDEVRALQRGDYPALAALGVEQVRADVADAEAVRRAADGCEAVVHVAAKAGVWGDERAYFEANVLGTQAVVAACKAAGVGVLVYTSSPSVVFGDEPLEGVDERAPYPERYLTAYPRTKAIAERMVLAASGPGLATVALRPHLVWGPGDPHLVPRIVARARAGRLRKVAGGGALVDTTYVDCAAHAHVLALDALIARGAASPAAGRAYFVAQGEPRPIGEIVDRICEAAGERPARGSVPLGVAYAAGAVAEAAYRALRLRGEPPMTRFLAKQLGCAHHFDLTAARRDLGYAPVVSFDEGMARLARSLRA